MPAVFVVKTADDGEPVQGVFGELQAGRARIGWSYQDNLNLRSLRERIDQEVQLDGHERDAKRCLGFLTRVESGDYLLYPHQPKRGKFTVVQVTGEYGYSTKEDGLDGDFRSFRPCSLETREPVDMYDEIVPSQLRHRLGRPGRFSEVSDTSSFFIFLKNLPNQGRLQDDSNRASVDRIHKELREKLPEALYREFSRADLSRRFCSDLFERMGYTAEGKVKVQEGRAEAGSDVVVTVGDPLLPEDGLRVGVQVFAYKETVEESALQSKLDQLLRGWDENSLDYGVLLTTGRCSKADKAAWRNHQNNEKNKKEKPSRQVRLIEGDDLANLFLKHFPPATA